MSNFILGQVNQYIPDLLKLLAVILIYALLDLWVWAKKSIYPKLEAYYDAHTTAEQRKAFAANESLLKVLGHAAYIYAEQVYNSLGGAQKLQNALSFFQANMSRYGLTNLTADAIREAIEEAWRQENPGKTPKVSTSAVPPTTTPSGG